MSKAETLYTEEFSGPTPTKEEMLVGLEKMIATTQDAANAKQVEACVRMIRSLVLHDVISSCVSTFRFGNNDGCLVLAGSVWTIMDSIVDMFGSLPNKAQRKVLSHLLATMIAGD